MQQFASQATERAVLADDVDDLVLVRRAVLKLEVEERERGGGARRPVAARLRAGTSRRPPRCGRAASSAL